MTVPASTRRRRFVRVLVWNLLVCLALCYAAEGWLNTWGPYSGLPRRNGLVGGRLYTWGFEVRTNALGFRAPEIPPRQPDTWRVLVLGDSLTWGAGLAEEQRYTERMAALLATSTARRVEVVNFGLSGLPTTRERDLLREHGAAVAPDCVVVGFCLNDTQPRDQDHSPERARFRERMNVFFRIFYAIRRLGLGHLGETLRDALLNGAVAAGRIPSWQTALDRTYATNSAEWTAFTNALGDIAGHCRERGLPRPVFAVLNQGTSASRPTDYLHPDAQLQLYLKWYRQAEAAAAAAGFDTVNFEAEIARDLADQPLGVNRRDVHPSAALNDVYARKLAPLVLDRIPKEGAAPRP